MSTAKETNGLNKTELPGRFKAGDRIVEADRVLEVVKSNSRYWTEELCHDLDEFDKLEDPGWYSTVELRFAEPTETEKLKQQEIQAYRAAEQAQKEKRRDEWAKYQADLEALGHDLKELNGNLQHSGTDLPERLSDLEGEIVGQVCEPGRDVSYTTTLRKFTDRAGRVAAVSYGREYDWSWGVNYWWGDPLEPSPERTQINAIRR